MQTVRFLDTPCGRIGIAADETAVTGIFFDGTLPREIHEGDSPLLRLAVRELEEYFAGTRRGFTFPTAAAGTPFQQKVWQALRTIPYGQTRTYAQIAAQVGSPKSCRAVGMANHRNPLPFVVPCHRVIGAGGRLTGYAGGLGVKEHLLNLERS